MKGFMGELLISGNLIEFAFMGA
ncbi:hypothetical protein DESC_360006 [Desulfosarcina cetonica]|nr:hypothetical protein DESC_360006 [Desulfosarcina cetonica]